ncbi:MAG: hypothetical protein DRG78_07365 [Epsilonproteobacteria bacterium]|nr:MAG: hypothetical protein DRG78_07365 [Campylobacterota bacterium]
MIQVGKPIVKEFLGRDKNRKELALMLKMGQSVVLNAPRRHGKTSIMDRVLCDIEDELLYIKIDIMAIANKRAMAEKIIDSCYELLGIKGFVLSTLSGIGKAVKDIVNFVSSYGIKLEDLEFSNSEKLLKDTDEDRLFLHALNLPQIIASKLDKKLIFAIDELGEIKDFKSYQDILKVMRSVFQHQEDVVFLFAGSQHTIIGDIFRNSSSAFYKFAQMYELKAMKEKDFTDYFNKLFSKYNIILYKEFTKDIVDMGNGIPYYIIKIANSILFHTILGASKRVCKFSILRATYMVYKNEEQYFQLELSKLRGKQYQQKLLEAFAMNFKSKEASAYAKLDFSNSNREIKQLLNSGLLSQNLDKKYYITDPFLSIYLCRN